MGGNIASRLRKLGLVLPAPPRAVANYRPFVRLGDLVQLAGEAPSVDGVYAVVGKVGAEVGVEDARRAARICAMNLLSTLQAACDGDLDHVDRFLMVRGFVNATAEFERVPYVIDAASDLFIEVFGSAAGSHARTSIGCATLPSRVAVEIDALVAIRP